ncbi:MAG: NYN domain-containing protein, partial [Hymenobacter sp.]
MLTPNTSPAAPPTGAASPYAAVFIDFENIYYFLKNHYLDPQDPHDYALDLLRSLRETLRTTYGLDSLVLNAYADFDKLPTGPQGPLYLMGVTTRNVLGTDHKNAADMQLCIDALEVLYTRPAIGTFVLVGGDRDYIPVIQHLRRQARLVKVVGFRESVSGDLLQLLGQEHFLDARDLLPAERLQALEDHRTARLARGEEIRRLGCVLRSLAGGYRLHARQALLAQAADFLAPRQAGRAVV